MNNRTKQKSRRGFSLLELLAVMSIMAMLTTLAVTSYFSAIRGMTRRSAVKHLANTLILARQRACMEGTRVSVMVFNEVSGYDNAGREKIVPSYVVCKEVGRISSMSSGILIDEFAPLNKMFGTATLDASYLGSIRLYNLTQGKWSNVLPSVTEHKLTGRASAYQMAKSGTEVLYDIPAYGFVKNTKVPNQNDATWQAGDSYGIEAAPVSSLPRGFEFDELQESLSKVVCVTFKPDGSSTDKTVGIRTTQTPVTRSRVSVQSDGTITYDEKWN
jgi:prepilin-type N-terminal cleavage/methylation domain-containing protein